MKMENNMKPQIVFFARALWGGGAERAIYDLAHGFDKEKYEVYIVHLFNVANVPLSFDPSIPIYSVESLMSELPALSSKRLADKNFGLHLRHKISVGIQKVLRELGLIVARYVQMDSLNLYNLLMRSLGDILPQVYALHTILSQFRKDALVISIMEECTVRMWLKQIFSPQPYMASLHCNESSYMPLLYPEPQRLAIENWCLNSACRTAQRVIFPSEGGRTDLIEYYNLDPALVQTIPNPVNRVLIQQKQSMPLTIDLPAVQRKTTFVHIGRFDHPKNHELLIQASQILRKKYHDFVVFCLGSGWRRDTILRLIAEYGLQNHIFLLGELPNPFPILAKARALVLTSTSESFSLVLIEAMICGAAAISVDCPYGPKEILDHGQYGLLVPLDDPAALSDAMYRIAHDEELYQHLQIAGFERARHYDLPIIVQQWEKLLAEPQTTQYERSL